MPITQHTDSNGWTYNAVSTAEWYGSYGDTLRAAGWRYCGYGTWGIYITQGADCATRTMITPFIHQPIQQDVAAPAPANVVTDKACGGCRKSATPSQPGAPQPATPTPGARPAPSASPKYPWWLWVLVALTLAQVVYGRND